MSKKRCGLLISGFLIGSAIGTVTGLLMAPRAGKETRQLMKKSIDAIPELAEDLSTSVQLQADRLSESARANWDDTLTRLREALAAGLEASQRQFQEQFPQEAKDSPKERMSMRERERIL